MAGERITGGHLRRRSLAAIALVLTATLALGIAPATARLRTGARFHVRVEGGPRRRHPHHRHHHRHHDPNYVWQMLQATNASRTNHGLPRLVWDRRMSDLVQRHTRAMANAHRLFHTTDVGRYLRGVSWSSWGENIGWTTGGVSDLERAFMRSPDHRPHILSHTFHHVAVGAVKDGRKLWVTIFFYG